MQSEALDRLAMVAKEAQVASDAPVFAHLAVAVAGRVRDVFLGPRSVIRPGLAVVDWRSAPLAEVFFSAAAGAEYEVEAEGRTLSGTLLARHLFEWAGGEVSAVVGDDAVWRRGPTGWVEAVVEDTAGWGAPLAGPPVPLGAEVVLD
ncbi:MAG: hypothetical protein KC933_37655, partial [Myxococcales bacterium]|nr:hypothetical protein [Myxococcales bacterium]